MKLNNKLTLSLLLIGLNAFSARVAVTDPGTDFSHEWLTGRALVNTKEVIGNRVDDDRNGKVDDIYGWNFADNYGKVFFKEHGADVPDKVYKIMDVLSRIQAGSQTPDDEKYWKENIQSLTAAQKQKLSSELNFFGQYAHSTHVSGIIASVSPDARMMSNRVFPDTPLSFVNPMAASGQKKGIMDMAYKLLAVEMFLSVLANGSAAEAVGALGLGTETVVRDLYQPFVRALGRLDLDPADTVFFPLHTAVDDHHQATLLDIARHYARTPEGRADVAKGMRKALSLRASFWDWLYERAMTRGERGN